MAEIDCVKPLKDLQQTKEFFVGIDSDGCVFDTMGIKQRKCFSPCMITSFGLEQVAEAGRQCKEFVDLFSKTRGINRHKAIKRILTELLPSHPMVKEQGFEVPQFEYYCQWVDDPESLLSNEGLELAIAKATNPEAKSQLECALAWSRQVNKTVEDIVKDIPPFPHVRDSLEKVSAQADAIVCSATPCEALTREWQEHDIAKYVKVIAGQEMGTKAEHLNYATKGKYEKGHVLMIGDAPGDMKAAKANDALFYPINPGGEAQSWKRFHEESFDKFINGQYAGEYEEKVIAEFQECLPDEPPWLKTK